MVVYGGCGSHSYSILCRIFDTIFYFTHLMKFFYMIFLHFAGVHEWLLICLSPHYEATIALNGTSGRLQVQTHGFGSPR